jgi:hypothetical protein
MSRIKSLITAALLSLCFGLLSTANVEQDKPIPMPLYKGNLNFPVTSGIPPQPNRDESVRKWLSPSVRIHVPGAIGSGTICYYDRAKNIAYVISCAHLFDNPANASQTFIDVFYKNEKKLNSPQRFPAKVISYKAGYYSDDISFMSFQPDWIPENWFPIASEDHPIANGQVYYSCGCDNGSEVACYFVKPQGIDTSFLATIENSPRPGRSGGGLMDKNGWYVGICVRTSDVSGQGTGFFVHLKTIHDYCRQNKLAFLLGLKIPSSLLKKIPIIDRNSPQGKYDPEYIPTP